MFKWYTHLCDYHNVTQEQALKLGTRASGRKPNLPYSETCKAVSGMTFEDIWASDDRESINKIFKFYRDQGAWSTFRQCVRHKDLENLHLSYFSFLIQNKFINDNSHICEYGCGVAPFITTFLKYLQPHKGTRLSFSLADVDCDHFDFANYRLNRIVNESNFNELVTLNFEKIEPQKLPSFNNKKLDVLFCFEVLEHVPSPIKVIENIINCMNPGGIYIENFIKHDVEDDDDIGPDLTSARNEREMYYDLVYKNFTLLHPSEVESKLNPSVTRIWQRNL
jgi:SAM-dependent methyltransferase